MLSSNLPCTLQLNALQRQAPSSEQREQQTKRAQRVKVGCPSLLCCLRVIVPPTWQRAPVQPVPLEPRLGRFLCARVSNPLPGSLSEGRVTPGMHALRSNLISSRIATYKRTTAQHGAGSLARSVLGQELFFYLITLSARYSTDCGIVKPICFAALRLITKSNFIGCSTGRSPGLAPFNILST